MGNPLLDVVALGQSLWLDNIRRALITSGELKKLIDQDGLRGLTSNPAIFEKAIAGSSDYVADLDVLGRRADLDAKGLFEILAVRDIQDTADLLKPVYETTRHRDGYVSLEVSPTLAHDAKGTVEEARRLWKTLGRPNAMIKVPGTSECIPAIQTLLSEGININITLLFAQEAYERVAEAYLSALEARAARGEPLSHVASVASFFVSRIDTLVDSRVDKKLQDSKVESGAESLKRLRGKVAVANAKLTYQRYKELFRGPRWEKLAAKGAQTQRLLWASTSTKNPAYRDVYYVEELIGPDTVDTVPPATLDAFRDHGKARASLEENLDDARATMAGLAQVGISMKEVTDQLLTDAVRLFAEPFEKLLATIEKHRKVDRGAAINPLTHDLPGPLAQAVSAALEDWQVGGKVARLWARDASLWTGQDEAGWMGWLDIAREQLAGLDPLVRLAGEVKAGGFRHILLLGMGGSSLGPEMLAMTFGRIEGFPELLVLDSTDPAQLQAFEAKIDVKRTLFIVASKSGSTLEPNIFKQYFFERAKAALGADEAGKRFIAITDPGSKMEQVAQADRFRHIFHGKPSIGGRYSVISAFGTVPAAAMGLDVKKLLERVDRMAQACGPAVAPRDNPGVRLGLILGALARQGRDKVTLAASPGIRDIGGWLEQLLAESTGKDGKGLIPVDREDLSTPDRYGADRIFVYLRLESAPDPRQDQAVEALARAGHPVVRISLAEPYDLGQELFRWEIATAVAGSVLGINPFNQPDVEASKIETKKLTSGYESQGALPPETPFFEGEGIKLFADGKNAAAITAASGGAKSLAAILKAHLDRVSAGDYVALLAYVEMNDAHGQALQGIRHLIRDRKRVATCLGFGPRFLHSTGQAYKGGPNSGVFLQITCDDARDLPVPGQKYTFGVVKAAQARGDFQVLADRGRRALRIHLGKDVRAGLAALKSALDLQGSPTSV